MEMRDIIDRIQAIREEQKEMSKKVDEMAEQVRQMRKEIAWISGSKMNGGAD